VSVSAVRKKRSIAYRDPYFDACVSILNFNGVDLEEAQITRDAAPAYRAWTKIASPYITQNEYFSGISSLRVDASDGINTTTGDTTYDTDFWIERDYTMEFRMRFDSAASGDVLAAMREDSSGIDAWKFFKQSDGSLRFVQWNGATQIVNLVSGVGKFNANQWYHIAMSRHKTTWRIFIDGTIEAEAEELGTPQQVFNVGIRLFRDIVTTSGDYFAGYCDGIRFTKGVARYTQNFSIPTGRFPEQ
jgi:hypothetical protein